MKITGIRCTAYEGTMEDPDVFWEERLIRPVDIYPQFRAEGPTFLPRSGASAYRLRSAFVHIETDGGIVGTGGPITEEQAFLIRANMAPLLLGRDPLATEQLWDILYRYSVHGRKGVEMMAISALDCALWDLKGRHFDAPVHVLLGGPCANPSPPTRPRSGTPWSWTGLVSGRQKWSSKAFGPPNGFPGMAPSMGAKVWPKTLPWLRPFARRSGPTSTSCWTPGCRGTSLTR